MTDRTLIEGFLKGDIDAFNILVRRWESPVYNFINRTVGNRETARDLCQVTMIRVYKKLKSLRDPDKFSSWIYQIAYNLCRDEFKKKKNKRILSIEDTLYKEGETTLAEQLIDKKDKKPDELCHNDQIGTILNRAIQTLPEEQRVVIIMKQYQELKFTEIADILKEPVNTVKSRLYYGLRALRKTLELSNYNKEVLFNEM